MKHKRALVIGGSLGGLITGLMLRQAGIDVEICERNATSLESRGAGLRVPPVMRRLFMQAPGIDLGPICTETSSIRYVDRAHGRNHKVDAVAYYSSWGALHKLLMSHFGCEHYHLDAELTAFSQNAESATAEFRDGTRVSADLLVFADGMNSTGRRLLFPAVEPSYAGYICWRGYVREEELTQATRASLADAMTVALLNPEHVHVYPIPSAAMDLEGTGRCFNYIWYRNLAAGDGFTETMTDSSGVFRLSSVPPGGVRPHVAEEMKAAARQRLPAEVAEVIDRTAAPFIQAISDMNASAMVRGRVCLIGDAASAGRPHLGAATAKATVNAFTLAQMLAAHPDDIPQALALWEPAQVQFGDRITARNKALGDQFQFHSDSRAEDARIRPGIDDFLNDALAPAIAAAEGWAQGKGPRIEQ